MSAGTDAAAGRVREMLERIANAAGVDATVEVHDADDGLHAEFVAEDLGVLIGRHGETIDAIQHLAYRIAGHGGADRVSVLVDAAGYRERRATTLRATADRAAQQAISGRRAVSLDAMSALERKVIHQHLKSRHDVQAY